MNFRNISVLSAVMAFAFFAFSIHATVVEIRTPLGDIEVNLFDETTPETVENFLSYVNSGAYANNVVHRSVPGFIIQGGGYTYTGPVQVVDGSISLDTVAAGLPIANDPKWSNLRGTIAMAKTSDPDSATSQWFINLSDNSQSLDVADNSGGFTVFGQVMGDGMVVVDQIADLDFFGTSSVPVLSAIGDEATDENLVVISDIVVTDATVNSAADLSPVENTLISSSSTPVDNGSANSDSSGGAFSWISLMLLAGLAIRLTYKRN